MSKVESGTDHLRTPRTALAVVLPLKRHVLRGAPARNLRSVARQRATILRTKAAHGLPLDVDLRTALTCTKAGIVYLGKQKALTTRPDTAGDGSAGGAGEIDAMVAQGGV